jgi:hypothetical protein
MHTSTSVEQSIVCECEFHPTCRRDAVTKDALSLLSRRATRAENNTSERDFYCVQPLVTFVPEENHSAQSPTAITLFFATAALCNQRKQNSRCGETSYKLPTPVFLDIEAFRIVISITSSDSYIISQLVIFSSLFGANTYNEEKKLLVSAFFK